MSKTMVSSPAWWHEPMMWLVVGGPSVVVAACLVTLGMALYWPDPALVTDADAVPAVQARNHALTPPAKP